MGAKIKPDPVKGEAVCREPMEVIPLCGKEKGGKTYRAMISTYPNVATFDLLPKGTYPADNMQNPTPDDIAAFKDRYHPRGICRLPDKARPGQTAIYARFADPQTVSRGGRAWPYPYDIPQCSMYQNKLRALYCPAEGADKSSYEICMTHYLSAKPAGALNPRDADLPQLWGALSSVGAENLCQMRVSNSPEGHALFFSLDSDPLASLEGQRMNSSTDTEAAIGAIRKGLPEAMSACLPPIEDEKNAAAWMNEINRKSDEVFGEKISANRESASQIAGEISPDLNPTEHSELTETVAFGITNGMPREEIGNLALELGTNIPDSEDFLRHMQVLVNLRVAQILNSNSTRRISDDFDDFINSVTTAIKDGEVRLRGKSMADAVRMPLAFAYFNSESGDIALNGKTSLSSAFLAIVHESYHAYQYLRNVPKTVIDTEMEAWERSTKAAFLLGVASEGRVDMPWTAAMYEEGMINLPSFTENLERGRLDCLGVSPKFQENWQRIEAPAAPTTQEWQRRLYREFMAGRTANSKQLFRAMYRMMNHSYIEKSTLYTMLVKLGDDLGNEKLDRTYFPEEDAWPAMGSKLRAMKSAPPKSTEKALAAFNFLNICFYYAAMASYLEPELFEGFMEYYYQNSREAEDALAYLRPISR